MGQKLLKKRIELKRKKINLLFMMLSALGAFLSLYLWNIHLTGDEVSFCVTGGCQATLTGEYSLLLGVPIAAMGFSFYLGGIILTFLRSKINDQVLDNLLYFHGGVGLIFTLYLRYLEYAKIGDICIWCWGSVVIVAALLLLIFFDVRLFRKAS